MSQDLGNPSRDLEKDGSLELQYTHQGHIHREDAVVKMQWFQYAKRQTSAPGGGMSIIGMTRL